MIFLFALLICNSLIVIMNVLNKIINNMNKITQSSANRMAKLKLMKDLKYGKVHLRQSLLQLSEFQDVDRLFRNRKDFYSIEDQQVNFVKQKTQENQQQANILISPIQRIELYRKQKMNKKMKEKMTQGLQTKQINHSKPRVPKTTKMLQKFQNKYRNQMPVSYKQQLRQSQLNLQKIKRNDKIQFDVATTQKQKPLYQSRLSYETGRMPHTEGENQQNCNPRKRFMSLKTSLPEREKFLYPSIRQIMEGKLKQNIKGPIIDIKRIQNTLDGYLNQSMKKMRIRVQKQIQSRNSGINSPTKVRRLTTYKEPPRRKTKSNVQRSFTRSQQSSKNMIETMSSFYETKHEKKHNFDVMFNNLKYDRPLTSSIRRKNYTILGKESMHPISNYRQVSQHQRQKLRQKNHQFYCGLIEGLQVYHQQEIPTTVYVVQQVRRVFQTEYLFTKQIFKEILQTINTMDLDHRAQDILHRLAAFVGYNLSFTEQKIQEKSPPKSPLKSPLKSPAKIPVIKR